MRRRRPARGRAVDVPVSMRQQVSVGRHLLGQRLRRHRRFPLVMQLEPLFACNLACAGCGKVQFPPEIMRGRMPVATAVAFTLTPMLASRFLRLQTGPRSRLQIAVDSERRQVQCFRASPAKVRQLFQRVSRAPGA